MWCCVFRSSNNFSFVKYIFVDYTMVMLSYTLKFIVSNVFRNLDKQSFVKHANKCLRFILYYYLRLERTFIIIFFSFLFLFTFIFLSSKYRNVQLFLRILCNKRCPIFLWQPEATLDETRKGKRNARRKGSCA